MRRIIITKLNKHKIPIIRKRENSWFEYLGLIGIDGNISHY